MSQWRKVKNWIMGLPSILLHFKQAFVRGPDVCLTVSELVPETSHRDGVALVQRESIDTL